MLPSSLTAAWHWHIVTVIGAPVFCSLRTLNEPEILHRCWNCAVEPPDWDQERNTPSGGNFAVEAYALLVIDGHDPDAALKRSWAKPRRNILRLKKKPENV